MVASGGTFTVNGGGRLLLGTGTAVGPDGIVTVNSGATLTLQNDASDNLGLSALNLTLAGGAVNLTGFSSITGAGSDVLTGPTTLAGPTLMIGSSFALSASATTWSTLVPITGTLEAAANVVFAGPVAMNNSNFTLGGTNPLLFTGAVTLNGVNNIVTNADTAVSTFGGVISGSGYSWANLTLNGTTTTGVMIISGANTYFGDTFINGGTVRAQTATARVAYPADATVDGGMQDPTGDVVTVASGATLQEFGNYAIYNPLVLSGSGVGGAYTQGAVVSMMNNMTTNNNFLVGPITLAADATVGAYAGCTLTLSGVVTGMNTSGGPPSSLPASPTPRWTPATKTAPCW